MGLAFFIYFVVTSLIIGTLFWFNRELIQEKININNDLVVLSEVVSEYSTYLDRISKMDIFYGEPVVMNLVQSTKDLKENLKEFHIIYFEDLEEYEEEEEDSERKG